MTAESNRFQGKLEATAAEQQGLAAAEFDAISNAVEQHGVTVVRIDDTPEPHTPDSIFPNNWVSFHADGTVVLYPMEAENRRTERRQDILERLDNELGFDIHQVIDLSHRESQQQYLEGTGSMVLDRVNRIAYACLSSRTHLDALGEFAQRMDYDVLAFDAVDGDGVPIYHTNVLMNVGSTLAVICAEALPREDQREAVLKQLADTGHEVVELSFGQLNAFAGNMLELKAADGGALLAMSTRAYESLRPEQLDIIQRHARVVHAPINNIEDSAGGSVRCMLAEIHLPKEL